MDRTVDEALSMDRTVDRKKHADCIPYQRPSAVAQADRERRIQAHIKRIRSDPRWREGEPGYLRRELQALKRKWAKPKRKWVRRNGGRKR